MLNYSLAYLKASLNRYAYLHWNITILNGHFSCGKYKKMMADKGVLEVMAQKSAFNFPITSLFPCYQDCEDSAGARLMHYFMQDLHIAQRIFTNNPVRHIDIGSRIDGFVTHVASFREIEVFDIRFLDEKIPNVIFAQMDIMDEQNIHEEITDSISCLHALEHFGLGRYGDPINFDGFYIGFKNITKMLKLGGKFYFSVPLGPQRIEFHAHRVFSLSFLKNMLNENYQIDTFSYVDDHNIFHPSVEITDELLDNNCNCKFGCAIFELTKNAY